MTLQKTYGILPDGRSVTLFELKNQNGLRAGILDYGATLYSLFTPDRLGLLADIVLGPKNLNAMQHFSMTGSTIGRCANRIAHGQFCIHGKNYQLETRADGHTLHSGCDNYAHHLFRVMQISDSSITLYHRDLGQAGFECYADVYVTFTLTENNQLRIRYEITPDGDTIINPTNHAYFNLNGTGNVLDHYLQIFANEYTPSGYLGMPQGDRQSVQNTPLDFRSPTTLGNALAHQTSFFGESIGFDHNYVLDTSEDGIAAILYSPTSGRRLVCRTDLPGMQLFTPCSERLIAGKNGAEYGAYAGVCLETQFFPNAVNCPQYPSPVVSKNSTFTSETSFEFSTLDLA